MHAKEKKSIIIFLYPGSRVCKMQEKNIDKREKSHIERHFPSLFCVLGESFMETNERNFVRLVLLLYV